MRPKEPLTDSAAPEIEPWDYQNKLVLVGPTDSGKTALFSRLKGESFPTDLKSTLGVDFCIRQVSARRKSIQFQIWDTAGNPRYNTFAETTFKQAATIALCIDLEKPNGSITYIKKHVAGKTSDNTHFVVVFTKADLLRVEPDLNQLESLAQDALDLVGVKTKTQNRYVVTSSQNDTDDAFTNILETWAKQLLPPIPRPQPFSFSGNSSAEMNTPPSTANPNPLSKLPTTLMGRIKTRGGINDTENNADLPPPSGTQYRV